VWFDGIYNRDAAMGLGWAVKNAEEGFDGQKLKLGYNVDGCEAYGPDCAEMLACAYALKSIPDKSAVVMHTGSNGLIRWMEAGLDGMVISQHAKWLAVKPFREAFELALAQTKRMIDVSFQYVRKNNEGMATAHELAESATDDEA